MAPVTELALLPLKAGLDIESEDSAAFKIHTELARTVLRQPGCQRLFWSREHENPDNLRWFIDWDSIEDHKNFIKAPEYKPFFEGFGEILGGSPKLWHAHFQPHPPSGAKALGGAGNPATEVLHVFFPTDLSEENQKDFEERISKLAGIIEKADGCLGFASGWVEEQLEIPDTEEKGKVYAGLVGWKSLEAHHAFRETEVFKENISLLREAKERKGVNMVHVYGKEVQKA